MGNKIALKYFFIVTFFILLLFLYFKFTKPSPLNEVENKVIEENINPAVASHGGMIQLQDFDEESGRVLVMLQGSCSGCASSTITLKMGVENMLKHYVPEVTAVDGMDDPNFNTPYY